MPEFTKESKRHAGAVLRLRWLGYSLPLVWSLGGNRPTGCPDLLCIRTSQCPSLSSRYPWARRRAPLQSHHGLPPTAQSFSISLSPSL